MRIHHLYEDENGESHFGDIEIEWVSENSGGKVSKTYAPLSLRFREVPDDWDTGWHAAPRKQFIINLAGGVAVTASDGETREIRGGEVLLVEDLTGKGHASKALDGKIRHCIMVPIE